MSIGFDHMTVAVTDLGAAEQFLAVLGFRREKSVVVSGPAMSAYMGIAGWEADHVTLVLDGAPVRQEIQLLLFHSPTPASDPNAGQLARLGFNHICFRVDDLDATLAAFAAIGHQPRIDVLHFHDRRLVFLDGPAGVVVELAEWTSAPSA